MRWTTSTCRRRWRGMVPRAARGSCSSWRRMMRTHRTSNLTRAAMEGPSSVSSSVGVAMSSVLVAVRTRPAMAASTVNGITLILAGRFWERLGGSQWVFCSRSARARLMLSWNGWTLREGLAWERFEVEGSPGSGQWRLPGLLPAPSPGRGGRGAGLGGLNIRCSAQRQPTMTTAVPPETTPPTYSGRAMHCPPMEAPSANAEWGASSRAVQAMECASASGTTAYFLSTSTDVGGQLPSRGDEKGHHVHWCRNYEDVDLKTETPTPIRPLLVSPHSPKNFMSSLPWTGTPWPTPWA